MCRAAATILNPPVAQGTNNYDLFLKGSYSEQSIRNILQDHWNNGIKVTTPAAIILANPTS